MILLVSYNDNHDNQLHMEVIMPVTKGKALSGFGTLAGTLDEVRSGLKRSRAQRAIALTFAHENERTVRAIAGRRAIQPRRRCFRRGCPNA